MLFQKKIKTKMKMTNTVLISKKKKKLASFTTLDPHINLPLSYHQKST